MNMLRETFGQALKENACLAGYSTARIGGTADGLITAGSSDELANIVQKLWDMEIPSRVLGCGSNVLISDDGYRGVIVINQARNFKFREENEHPFIWSESGANLGVIARQTVKLGMSGLEWAAAIPGSVGGAVYGNAGAHGGEIKKIFMVADILHHESGRENWCCDRMQFGYRTSVLKSSNQPAVILSARFALQQDDPERVQAAMDEFIARRRTIQPVGASLGSMFKNPPGDFAGRLIEQAGLKGARFGGAEISDLHANFFVNHEEATAMDIWKLIHHCQTVVMEKFGINLELEIELLGDWPEPKETRSNG